MTSQTLDHPARDERAVNDSPVIDSGYHGVVQFEQDRRTVRKSLLGATPREVAERARNEFQYLQRFSEALAGLPGVYSPRPHRVDPDAGWLTMDYVPGVRVDRALADLSSEMEDHVDQIADNAAVAAERFIAQFDEPYYSLSTHNMLYDLESQRLGLIDFTPPLFQHRTDSAESPLAITLGAFLGGTTFHTTRFRRATWLNHGYWTCQKRLSTRLISRITSQHDVSLSLIHDISRRKYRSLSRNGNMLQKLWYASVGQILFNWRSKSIIDSVARTLDSDSRGEVR